MSADKSDGKPSGGARVRFWLAAALAVVLVFGLLACVYYTVQIIVNPEPMDKFTELYLLGPDGRAENYPKELVIGENKTMIACVANHENSEAFYDLAVRYNNSTTEKTVYREYIVLRDNATWQKAFTIEPDIPGKKVKVEFDLYKNGDTNTPYRECYVWLNVSEPYRYVNTSAGAGRATGS